MIFRQAGKNLMSNKDQVRLVFIIPWLLPSLVDIIFIGPLDYQLMISSQQGPLFGEEQPTCSKDFKQNGLTICDFTTWLKLNRSAIAQKQKFRNSVSLKQELPREITMKSANMINFHSFKKFNSYEFSFQKIYSANETKFSVAKDIDVYDELVTNNRDFCLLAIGGINSGIQNLCENNNNEGIFSLIVCSLYDQIESVSQKNMQKINESEFISNLKLTLKFLVISNEKIFDLNSPKIKVNLKDNKNRIIVSDCQIFEPSSVYDLSRKFQQILKNRRLIYPESIFIVEGELSYDRPSVLGEISSFTRYFSLIEWQKSLGKTQMNVKNGNNNMSLLNLNMCLYELYKYSTHKQEGNIQQKGKQLSAIFRKSLITKHLKNFIIGNNKLIVFGFVACQEDEQEMYQTLMVCKNAAKIKKNGKVLEELRISSPISEGKKIDPLQNFKGHSTEPVSTQKNQKKNSRIDLLRVKEQLQKILKQKETSEQQQKQKKFFDMIKIQGKKRKKLRNIRYQKQQLQLKEQIKEACHSRHHSNQQLGLPIISNQTSLENSKTNQRVEKYLINIQSQEQNLKKEVEEIRSKLVKNMRQNSSFTINHSFLKQQIHRQENQIMDYMAHKQKIIQYLKSQARQLKKSNASKNQSVVYPFKLNKRSRRTIEREFTQPNEVSLQDKNKNTLLNNYNQEFQGQMSRKIRIMTDHHVEQNKKPPRVSNKRSYLFEKRKIELKQKIRQNKQQMNNYFEEAAKKFQQYSRVKA